MAKQKRTKQPRAFATTEDDPLVVEMMEMKAKVR
jgi:hypothetical protein